VKCSDAAAPPGAEPRRRPIVSDTQAGVCRDPERFGADAFRNVIPAEANWVAFGADAAEHDVNVGVG
jgi:hypothetical protein